MGDTSLIQENKTKIFHWNHIQCTLTLGELTFLKHGVLELVAAVTSDPRCSILEQHKFRQMWESAPVISLLRRYSQEDVSLRTALAVQWVGDKTIYTLGDLSNNPQTCNCIFLPYKLVVIIFHSQHLGSVRTTHPYPFSTQGQKTINSAWGPPHSSSPGFPSKRQKGPR